MFHPLRAKEKARLCGGPEWLLGVTAAGRFRRTNLSTAAVMFRIRSEVFLVCEDGTGIDRGDLLPSLLAILRLIPFVIHDEAYSRYDYGDASGDQCHHHDNTQVVHFYPSQVKIALFG